MLRYTINILFIFWSLSSFSQKQINDTLIKNDSIHILKPFNVRIGFDLGNFIDGKLNNNPKTAFFIDSNIYKNYFLCLEVGSNNNDFNNSVYHFQTKGNYLKLGVDYNIYDNWPGMDNQISMGFHYGYSNFTGTLVGYKINQPSNTFPPMENIVNKEFKNISGKWFEITSKLQVEVLRHIYLGYSISLKYLLSAKRTNEYEVPFIPGFYKVNSNRNFGFGMQYYISYRFGKD